MTMRMKQQLKRISAVLAAAITVSMMSTAVLAEESGSSSAQSASQEVVQASSTSSASQSVAASSSQTSLQTESSSSSSTAPTPTPTAEPTPTPSPVSGEPFVSNYDLRNASGYVGDLVRDKNNDVIPQGTLKVTIVDERLAGQPNALVASDVRLMPQNGTNFSAMEGKVTSVNGTSYEVVFNSLQYLGGDNTFKFDISYASSYQLPVTSLSVSLPQCYTIEKTGSQSGAQLRAPGLIVKEFNYGGASVPAGSPFTLNLTIFATSGDQALSDVTVSLALPENVSMATGNSSVYVGKISPESTKQISFEILPSANLTGGVASLQLTMSGVGETDGTKSDATATITVPVVQPERFEITKVEGAETLMVGEEGYLEVTFVNKGKEAISNVSAEISGTNLKNPGQSQYLGNVQPGTENTAEFSISSDTEGTIAGLITLTYESSNGQTKTITKEFSCTVNPGMEMNPDIGMQFPEEPMPEPSTGLPVIAWVGIVVGVLVVAAIVVVVVLKKKKAKQLAQLEAEDEDEDI